jgi:chromosome segregation ATPase
VKHIKQLQPEDKDLYKQISAIKRVLGEDATDVADRAMSISTETQIRVEELIKIISKLAANVSAMVIEAKANETLTEEQIEKFDRISEFAKKLGNNQFELLMLARHLRSFNELADVINREGFELADKIMELQNELLEIRYDLDYLGVFNNNPVLANYFQGKDADKT